ncbi:MAG: trehalose-6-phosphate synthase [Actinomycetes bacterium]|jgi:trehalose 6-phosphate synthase|nr:MAG: trehalose-6-phosphate synthase [Actinomycetota bacterium]
MGNPDRRLVVVANRLPVQMDEAGQWETSPGGLVSALAPLLKGRGGAWVGWPGSAGFDPGEFQVDGIDQVAVPLSAEDEDGFYHGFSNATLWPLYHDGVRPPEFHRTWWASYVEVNRRFAGKAASIAGRGDLVWVHDYQLQLVPAMLRALRPDVRIGFFLHIPFPPVELFSRLPWRSAITEGLLGADVVAFQTRKDAQNFAASARRFGGATGPDWRRLSHDGRVVRVDRMPIGIDVAGFHALATSDEVRRIAGDLRRHTGNPRKLVLGVDRLDYTKGIDVRLRAFQTVLERESLGPEDVQFLQIAVPSREAVPLYQETREEVERLVGQINGENARAGRPAVHYLYRSVDPEDLVGAYLAADVMMVTPLRDGMNLVAKEYVVSRVDETGVLILSEFAGASEQLGQALLVNPHDVDQMAATLVRALEMDEAEQRRRMRALRRVVTSSDVFDWAEKCLSMLVEE